MQFQKMFLLGPLLSITGKCQARCQPLSIRHYFPDSRPFCSNTHPGRNPSQKEHSCQFLYRHHPQQSRMHVPLLFSSFLIIWTSSLSSAQHHSMVSTPLSLFLDSTNLLHLLFLLLQHTYTVQRFLICELCWLLNIHRKNRKSLTGEEIDWCKVDKTRQKNYIILLKCTEHHKLIDI